MPLIESEFVERREPDWKRLAYLCDKAEVSIKSLQSSEVLELVRLYRAASTDLARLRTESTNLRMITFLNSLVVRAYSMVYRHPTKPIGAALQYALKVVAQSVRALRYFILASFLIFITAAILSWTSLATRPDLRMFLVSAQEEQLFDHWKETEFHEGSFQQSTAMWSFYATNNPRVAMMQTGTGLATGGITTLLINWRTGVQIGALSHDMNSVGRLPFLWSSLVPHGASELTGFLVGGGAGLALGWSFLVPGRRTRIRSVGEMAKKAGPVAVLAFVMMLIAAPFEAYFSFNSAFPQELKAVVGILILSAWILFWVGYGREETEELGAGGHSRPRVLLGGK